MTVIDEFCLSAEIYFTVLYIYDIFSNKCFCCLYMEYLPDPFNVFALSHIYSILSSINTDLNMQFVMFIVVRCQ